MVRTTRLPLPGQLAAVLLFACATPLPVRAVWPVDPLTGGVPVCTAANNQTAAQAASDGAGGAILAWSDQRGIFGATFVQRVSATGVPLWTANGVNLSGATGAPAIAPDGAGGAI